MSAVRIKDVCKRFDDLEVLHDINLSIEHGSFTVFVGPSGCGKSTLLKLICGLEEISSGELHIDDELVNDVPPAKRGCAMVFQSYALYPHMTVARNMGYALRLAKYPKKEIDERVQAAAAILQITELLDRKPGQLSGGQRQRVAIGRAIVREPKVFLFDEPLSNLDAALRVDMRVEIAKLRNKLGATMVYVTHDQVEAMTLADQIVVLRAGYVEQVGSPLELYHRPANQFVAGFIGSPKMNFIKTQACELNGDKARVNLPGGVPIEIPVQPEQVDGNIGFMIGVRPEHLVAGDRGDARIEGRVVVVEHLGSDTFAYIDVPGNGTNLMVRTDGNSPVRVGDTMSVGMRAAACHLFNEQGRSVTRYASHAN